MVGLFSLFLYPSTSQLYSKPTRASWNRILNKHGFNPSMLGLSILDENGRTVVSINANNAFTPASNQKILITAAALNQLGSDYEYVTKLWAKNYPDQNGILTGDLIVSGTGDPNISGRFTSDDPTVIFRAWARSLKQNGLKKIEGDLLIDDFYFDSERLPPSWKKKYESRWYSAQVGALNFNDNCLDFTIFPTNSGRRARYQCVPETTYVQIENRCQTVTGGELIIGLDRYPSSNRIVLKGKIPSKYKQGTRVFHVTVDDPGLFFGYVLRNIFSQEGIQIAGDVIRDRSRLPDQKMGKLLHRHASKMTRDFPVILKNSQNMHAEVLLKALGGAAGKVGSIQSGAHEVIKYLKKAKISDASMVIEDGSGLSDGNRISPLALTKILHSVSKTSDFDLFRNSMAIGGIDGTLKKRFKSSPAKGHVFAKTGYINSVSALSGYVGSSSSRSAKGVRYWSFSILVNKFPRKGGLWAARQLQESIVETIFREITAPNS